MKDIQKALNDSGLKVTPQRMAVLEAMSQLNHHPTAENIIAFVRKTNPNIASGTIYNILETFVKQGIIHKVKTERDIMRYDAIPEHHHHLYCTESDRIADYFDEDLNRFLENYFTQKKIPGFEIEDIKLQIKGRFKY